MSLKAKTDVGLYISCIAIGVLLGNPSPSADANVYY
jgi:hypothetical protein